MPAAPTPAAGFELSLVQEGPLHRLARRAWFRGRPLGPLGLGVALALCAWVPLLCLVMLERLGAGQGEAVSFLGSVSTHVRFVARPATLDRLFAKLATPRQGGPGKGEAT